jgi:hypothetical protein
MSKRPRNARRGRVKSTRKRIELENTIRKQNDKFVQSAEKIHEKEKQDEEQPF